MADRLEIWTLGGLTIKCDGVEANDQLPHKAQALIVYLACEGRPLPRQVLANLLWDGGPDSRVMNNLRVLLTNLRRKLAPYLIVTRTSVAFNQASPHWLDVEVLEEGLAAIRFQSDALSAEVFERLAPILDLYRGDFLEGFFLRHAQGFEEWQGLERERLRLQTIEALLAIVKILRDQGAFQAGLELVDRLLQLDPLHEEARRQKMLLLASSGRRHAALDQYTQYRRLLYQEVELPPALETIALYESIKDNRLPPAGDRPRQSPARPVPLPPPLFLKEADDPEVSPAEFIGREREIGCLNGALKLAQAGSGQLRFVIGGTGRGKTMLVREFARRAQAASPKLLVACGHCTAQAGLGDPYLPFQEILNVLTGDIQAGQIDHRQAKQLWTAMALTIPALVGHAPELIGSFVAGQPLLERAAMVARDGVPWFEQLNRLVAAGARLQLDQQHIFSQYSAVLRAIAGRQPLLLILEELHWTDPSSCSLLFHLSQELAQSPIMIVGVYRPEEVAFGWGQEPHPLTGVIDELKRQRGDIWLDLGEMSEEDGRRFVSGYLDRLPNRLDEAFREALYQRTHGHPLFTVELVQALQERGDLEQDAAGFWIAGRKIGWYTLPVKVEGVIEKRIHRLEDGLQATLNISSVEGEVFTAEVVARVQGVNEHVMVHRLSHILGKKHRLVAVRALERVGSQRLSRYRFRHNLYRQYLYRQLDDLERAYLHEAVAKTLEALYRDRTELAAARLAWHFQQAGMKDKAVDYRLQAGKQALALAAYREALNHLAVGLDLLPAMPDSPARAHQEHLLQDVLSQALLATPRSVAAPHIPGRLCNCF